MQENEEKGTISFAFETNDAEGLDVIDKLRVAILGPHPKRGGYVNSNRLVVEVKSDN